MKKLTLASLLFVAAIAVAASGCSKSNGSPAATPAAGNEGNNKGTGAPNDGNQQTGRTGTGNVSAALTAQPWCAFQESRGQRYQVRVTFHRDSTANLTAFALSQGTRGQVLANVDGTWSIAGDQMTTQFGNGPASTVTYSYAAVAATGAAQFTVTANGKQTTYDPCN